MNQSGSIWKNIYFTCSLSFLFGPFPIYKHGGSWINDLQLATKGTFVWLQNCGFTVALT